MDDKHATDRRLNIMARVRRISLLRASVPLVLSMALLAVLLRGTLPKTYVEKSFSDLDVKFLSYGIGESASWDWQSNWTKTDVGLRSLLTIEDGILSLEASFSEQSSQVAKIRKGVGLSIDDFPVFVIRAWVSKEALWRVRLMYEANAGGWSISPLENLRGSSSWETHSVDISGLVDLEQQAKKVAAIEILLENPPFACGYGPKRLMISEMKFLSRSARLKLSSTTSGDLHEDSYAIVLGLPEEALPRHGWEMRWVTLEFEATANLPFRYRAVLVCRDRPTPRGFLGPSFLSHREAYLDFYRLDVGDEPSDLSLEELTFVSEFVRGPSLIVAKIGFEAGGFTSLTLRSVRIVYHLPLLAIPVVLTDGLVQQMLLLLACIVFLLPLGVLVLAFKANAFDRRERLALVVVSSVGLASRVALLFFTGHAYDMEVWSYCARSFYESGIFDIRNTPFPVTYYIVLLGYVPYSVLKWFGFQDMRFLNHVTGVVESAFIKFPYILSDLVAMFLLIQILKKLGDKRAVENASLYWLNPLTILLSGVWGMYDTVAVTFFLCGLVSLFLFERYKTSAVLFALSGLTKGFGILGFIPLMFVLVRKRKKLEIVWVSVTATFVTLLAFFPMIATGGLPAILDFGVEVMRGRAGMGSQAFFAGASYMSFLDLIGLRPQAVHLTILLTLAVLCLAWWLIHRLTKSLTVLQDIGATSLFVALAMIAVYLLFVRVYEQYYLWILPFLVLHSFTSRKATPAAVGLVLGGCIAGVVVPIGLLLVGKLFYFMQVNLPADGAILAVIPTYIVVITLLSVVDLKIIKGDSMSLLAFILLVSMGGGILYELAHYVYYETFSWIGFVLAGGTLALLLLAGVCRVVGRRPLGFLKSRMRDLDSRSFAHHKRPVLLFFSFISVALFLLGVWVGCQQGHAGVVIAQHVYIEPSSPHVLLLNVTAEDVTVRGAVYSIPRRANVTYEILYTDRTVLQPPLYEGARCFISGRRPLHYLEWKPSRLGVYFLLLWAEEPTGVSYWTTFASPMLSGPGMELLATLWTGSFLACLGVVACLPQQRIHHWHIGILMVTLSAISLLRCFRWQQALPSIESVLFALLSVGLMLVGIVVLLSDLGDFLTFIKTRWIWHRG